LGIYSELGPHLIPQRSVARSQRGKVDLRGARDAKRNRLFTGFPGAVTIADLIETMLFDFPVQSFQSTGRFIGVRAVASRMKETS
jgi:hypothetical protein